MEEEKSEARTSSSPKLLAAERDVELAQAKFSADLRNASRAGRRLTTTIVKSARPVLVGVAVLTGLGLIVTVLRSRRRSRPLRMASSAPSSLWWELGRAAVVALASSAGKHLAARISAPLELEEERLAAAGQFATPGGVRPPDDS